MLVAVGMRAANRVNGSDDSASLRGPTLTVISPCQPSKTPLVALGLVYLIGVYPVTEVIGAGSESWEARRASNRQDLWMMIF